MKSNFDFLKKDWVDMAQMGEVAEICLYKDPNTALIKIRQLAEFITKAMAILEKNPAVEKLTQVERINWLKDTGYLTNDMALVFHRIRQKGNDAVHKYYSDAKEAAKLLPLVVKVAAWFKEVYGNDYTFDSSTISYIAPPNIDYQSEYERLSKLAEDNERLIQNLDPSKISLKSKEERKATVDKIRKKTDFTEAETRVLIDEFLVNANWEADSMELNYKTKKTLPEKGRNIAIAEWPCEKLKKGTSGFVDYALFIGTTLYGVIEAKKYKTDIVSALDSEARMYSEGVKEIEDISLVEGAPFGDYKVPFMYGSNGRSYNAFYKEKSGIFFLDGRNKKNLARPLEGFHSPEDLKILIEKDIEKDNERLKNSPIDFLTDKAGLSLRDYQVEAVQAVEGALLDGRKKILLTMATGTGKTRVALAIIYRLLESRKYKKILFLVDRKELGRQANETFETTKIKQSLSLKETYSINYLKKIGEEDADVHISTVQALMRRVLYDTENKPTVGQYDCIIVDEAHRGYLLDREYDEENDFIKSEADFRSKYKSVIEFFDADKIALTATPAQHTYDIFGDAVYQYSYRKAVLEGNLIDFEPPHVITTELSQNGITYEVGEKLEIYDVNNDKVIVSNPLEDEQNFDISQFNSKVITKNFNRAVCSVLANEIDPDSDKKTLIFAVNNEHADMIVQILREEYSKKKYVYNDDIDYNKAIEKITGEIKDVSTKVKAFKFEHYPTIVVTVDLLTTGIDIPSICNLVFMRKVKSRILYEQMLGRATRKCDKIGKEVFKVYDAVGLYNDLSDYSDMKPVVQHVKTTFGDLMDNIAILQDNPKRLENLKDQIVAKLQRKKINTKNVDEMFRGESELNGSKKFETYESFIDYIKNIPTEEIYTTLAKEAKLIRRMDEIKFSENYKIISNKEDKVISVTQSYGKNQKPEDYLEGFRKYIIENSDKIAAIKILKTNPKKFTKKDFNEIKSFLDSMDYSIIQLNSAYKEANNTAIVSGLISFIKNAIKGSPIVDKDEKIAEIMSKIKKLNRWNFNQLKLLENIEKQLKINELLTKDDISTGIFKRSYGGYSNMNKMLDEKLDQIFEIITEEILLN